MSDYVIAFLLIFILVYAKAKKVPCYDSFVKGAKKGLDLAVDIFPYIMTILVAIALLRASGITTAITHLLTPVFNALGVPVEVCELVILKPFSGNGSLAILSNIFSTYGADSYISRCACVIMGSSETTFYVSTVYLSKTSVKKLSYAIPVSLLASFIGVIFGCLICKVI